MEKGHERQRTAVDRFDPSFDYLELLELEPAEASRLGPKGLRDRIRQKKKEWTAQEVNPLYQQSARAMSWRL